MCGRVVVARPRDLLAAELGVDEVVAADLGLRWNVCPTSRLYAVAGAGGNGAVIRRMGDMVWGLLPSWATGPASGPRPINVRVESLLDRPHVAGALARRRCLVPVDGFYEWGPGPTGARQPFFFAPGDGSVLVVAAVWDRWVPASSASVEWHRPRGRGPRPHRRARSEGPGGPSWRSASRCCPAP